MSLSVSLNNTAIFHKMKHLQVLSSSGELIVDNLTDNCRSCLANCDFEGRQITDCPEYGGTRRQGIKSTSKCQTFFCCDKTKTTKLFKGKIESLCYSYPDIRLPIEQIKAEEQKKVNRLVHNLTSINAHNIQEIYDLVPQDVLAQNWKSQLKYIKEEITKDPDKAALMFLRIAKHNTHMKSEFSIYKKIEKDEQSQLEKRQHKLRNVLLNTLHTFFSDFSKRDVYVEVTDFFFQLRFDYETIQVAFYHLLENAAKYTFPKSKVTVSANENGEFVSLIFEMTSAYVSPEEKEEIMKEGVSGIMARKMNANGDGIGMWRINQMMEINDGKFHADFGPIKTSKMGFDFADNRFELKFKKH
ncbi:histidine kinase [Brumimicrobium salinarum]|nr:ATP-binding protein [Brumimicrobium salinarum]